MDKKKIVGQFAKWLQKISPPLPVGGMHISDFSVEFLLLRGGQAFQQSLRLPPGVVEGGKVKNVGALASALSELRRRVPIDPKKPLSVILSLPIRDVYIQTFSVPQVTEGEFSEAASLNAKMISPIDTANAYYSWQRISEGFTANINVEMLGAFVQKAVVDDFASAIDSSGFGLAAVEFESVSMSRNIAKNGLIGAGVPYVLIYLTAEGLNFVVVRNNVPHFHYFHSWVEIQGDGKAVTVDNFKVAFEDELERVINFYFAHWGGEGLQDALIVTSVLKDEIAKLMSEKFGTLKVLLIDPSSISAAYGAAIRGTVPRSRDTQVSLANLSALGVFQRQQLSNFVRIWKNVFAVSLGFLLLLFVSANVYLRTSLVELQKEKNTNTLGVNLEEYDALREEAITFNGLVSIISEIQKGGIGVSGLLVKLRDVSGGDIRITRIAFNPSDSSIILNGVAPNEGAAVDLKNRIAGVSNFNGVDLPLQNISPTTDGVSFNMTFKVSSFDFSE